MPAAEPKPTLELLTSGIAYGELVRRHGVPETSFFAALHDLLAYKEARVDPASVVDAAERLVAWARESGNETNQAWALRARGNIAFMMGDNVLAVELYRQALEKFGNDIQERGRTLTSLLHPRAMLGDFGGAEAAADEARSCFTQIGDRRRLARLGINWASVLHRQDRFREVLEVLDRAERDLEATPEGRADHEAASALRVTRATALIYSGMFEQAERAYEEARDYAQAHEMPLLAAQAEYNLGYLLFLRGQYVRAIRALDRARSTAEQFGDKLHLALCDLDQADTCVELNLYEDALQLAHAALGKFAELNMPYEQGKALTNMAVAQQFLGQDSAALDLLGQAETTFARAGNDFWVHMTHLYRAVVLLKLGRCFESLQLSELARQYFSQRQAPTKAIYATIVTARARAAAMDLAGAREAATQAVTALADLQAPWLQVQAHLLLGQLAERLGDRSAALAAYERAMGYAEATRGHINFDELRISFMRDKSQLYERYLEVLLDTDPPAERVWEHMERSKSRSLALVMAGGYGAIQPRGGEGSRVVSEITRLREELNWYYRQLDPSRPEGPGSGGVETLLKTIQEREHELLRAIRQLPSDEYSILEQESGVTLAGLREHLQGACWIEYFHCAQGFVAAVGDRESLHIVRLPGERGAIEAALRLLRFQVGKRALQGEHFLRHAQAFQQAAESHLRLLHQELIAPLAPYLREQKVLIVPHGVLHALPFGALSDGNRPLIESHTLAMAPSAAVFALCSRRPRSPFEQVLMVAAEPAAASDEIRAVSRSWAQAQRLEGAHSTLAAVKQAAESSRIVHIAAHGVFRADNPYFSALELADGRLNVIDIYNLHLRADMVVLSGCGTALGDVSGGDELIGLTRAFLYAGARAVIASLWDVDDATTAEFMESFYRHWTGGGSAADALREANLEFRRRYEHPYYWAPFQLVGSFS